MDRFISDRKRINFELANHQLWSDEISNTQYTSILAQSLFDYPLPKDILSNRYNPPKFAKRRQYSTVAYKILDAPDLMNNPYVNLLDCSIKNIVAIGLKETVYLFNMKTGEVTEVYSSILQITALKWSEDGKFLAIGTIYGGVIYDIQVKKICRNINVDTQINALVWDGTNLTIGTKIGQIMTFSLNSHLRYVTHQRIICDLKYNSRKTYLASGSSNGTIKVWDQRMEREPFQISGTAVCWHPQRNIIYSGENQQIHTWDMSGSLLNSIQTESPVYRISTTNDEVITAGNNLQIFDLETIEKLATLSGHTDDIYQLTMNHDQNIIISGSPDETLRFWQLSEKDPIPKDLDHKIHTLCIR